MNPFTPSFGTSPPLLVDRDGDLEDFREGVRGGPGSPERATLVTGLRGTGKTVMLNAYEDLAKSEGWVVVSETATPNSWTVLRTSTCPSFFRMPIHAKQNRISPASHCRAGSEQVAMSRSGTLHARA